MSCHICGLDTHNVFFCRSSRAIYVYLKTNKWIEGLLLDLYSKENCCVNIFGSNCFASGYTKSIDWIVEESQMVSLSLGDIILLNRNTIFSINTEWTREKYVYLYLAIKTIELIESGVDIMKKFTPRAIQQIKIDADYWAQRTYSCQNVCAETRAYQMYLVDHEN